MKMKETSSSSPSLSSSSSPVQERKLPPTQQNLPAVTPDATVSGNVEPPPPGSDLSFATPNSSYSTVSGIARSPPLDHSLDPPPKSQKLEAGSSARKLQSTVKLGASSLSSSSFPAKDSSPTQQYLPEATSTFPPLDTDHSLGQPNATVSGTAAFPPPGSAVSDAISQDPYRPLNLRLTKTPELLKKIADNLKQDYARLNQQKMPDFTDTLTPPEATKTVEKPKAMNFPISKITIGEWTSVMVYQDDLVAKCYFVKKKLMWEILDNVEAETNVMRLKRKIEILWADVLSFRASFHPQDATGTLEVELGKRPTFFMETNPLARKMTKWKQMEQDFTQDQSASRCRRHTLYFAPGVLQKNLEKLVSGDSFWSDLAKVKFPTLPQSLYFDIGYGNSKNNNRLFGGRSHMRNTGEFLGTQTNLMTGYGNSSNNNSDSQGSGRVEVGDSIKTDTLDGDGRHMGVIADDNRSEEVLGAQQLNEPCGLPASQGMEQVRSTGDDSKRGERES